MQDRHTPLYSPHPVRDLFPRRSLYNFNGLNVSQFHVVGIDAVLNDGSSNYIYHQVLKGFTESDSCGGICSSALFGSFDGDYNETECDLMAYEDIFVWAPGSAALVLPDDVGLPFGLNGYRSVGEYDLNTCPHNVLGGWGSSGVAIVVHLAEPTVIAHQAPLVG